MQPPNENVSASPNNFQILFPYRFIYPKKDGPYCGRKQTALQRLIIDKIHTAKYGQERVPTLDFRHTHTARLEIRFVEFLPISSGHRLIPPPTQQQLYAFLI